MVFIYAIDDPVHDHLTDPGDRIGHHKFPLDNRRRIAWTNRRTDETQAEAAEAAALSGALRLRRGRASATRTLIAAAAVIAKKANMKESAVG